MARGRPRARRRRADRAAGPARAPTARSRSPTSTPSTRRRRPLQIADAAHRAGGDEAQIPGLRATIADGVLDLEGRIPMGALLSPATALLSASPPAARPTCRRRSPACQAATLLEILARTGRRGCGAAHRRGPPRRARSRAGVRRTAKCGSRASEVTVQDLAIEVTPLVAKLRRGAWTSTRWRSGPGAACSSPTARPTCSPHDRRDRQRHAGPAHGLAVPRGRRCSPGTRRWTSRCAARSAPRGPRAPIRVKRRHAAAGRHPPAPDRHRRARWSSTRG